MIMCHMTDLITQHIKYLQILKDLKNLLLKSYKPLT